MYRFLLEGKWVALTVLLVLVVPLSVVAADWQWNRWESRKAGNALIVANSSQPPVAVGTLVEPGTAPDDSLRWRPVTAAGRYLGDRTQLVRRQVVGGRSGFLVLTPLATADGRVVPVVRGFLPLTTSGAAVVAPPAPSGAVTITGRLRAIAPSDIPVRPDDLPPGQVNRIDPGLVAAETGLPTYALAVEVTESSPVDSDTLVPLPAPEVTEGPHLSYVGQWALIGLASVVIWVIMVRREAQHQRELLTPAS